jgi:hypothetical protein
VTGISLHRVPAEEHGRGFIYQVLREMDEGGSRSRASLSLREHCVGNVKWGSFTADPGGCVKKGSGDGHLFP